MTTNTNLYVVLYKGWCRWLLRSKILFSSTPTINWQLIHTKLQWSLHTFTHRSHRGLANSHSLIFFPLERITQSYVHLLYLNWNHWLLNLNFKWQLMCLCDPVLNTSLHTHVVTVQPCWLLMREEDEQGKKEQVERKQFGEIFMMQSN